MGSVTMRNYVSFCRLPECLLSFVGHVHLGYWGGVESGNMTYMFLDTDDRVCVGHFVCRFSFLVLLCRYRHSAEVYK